MFKKIGLILDDILDNTDNYPWWTGLICLVIGGVLFFFGLYVFEKAQRFDAVAIHTFGRIYDVEFTYDSFTGEGDRNHRCFTHVTFETRAGSKVTFTDGGDSMLVWSTNSGRNRCHHKIGKVVNVAYDPQNPRDATVGWNKFRAYVTIIIPIMGIGFATFGVIDMFRRLIVRRFLTGPPLD